MDPFTQRMLERARARQEKIDQKLASSGQVVTKRKPLGENTLGAKGSERSPLKTPTKLIKKESLKSPSPVKSPSRRSSQKSDQKFVATPQKPRDFVVTKKEFRSPKISDSSRNSDVSVEINITHRDDIQIEVQVEEREAPISVTYNDKRSNNEAVLIEEIDDDTSKQIMDKKIDCTDEPRSVLRHNVKSRLDRLGILYSDKLDLSSPIHRTETNFSAGTPPLNTNDRGYTEKCQAKDGKKKFGRLAALADEINNWEDDLSHHNYHPEPSKPSSSAKPSGKHDASTLDVSIHSYQDIKKAIETTNKNKQTSSKPVNSRTFTKQPANKSGQRLEKNIVAALESEGYRRVSAGQSRLVYEFASTKRADPDRQEPTAASPNMAATVASSPGPAPPLAKKPSIKKYKAPTPPAKVDDNADDDKDKENNLLQTERNSDSDDNDNDAPAGRCIQTKEESHRTTSKGSPQMRRLAPKVAGNGDRNSVLSKAAMFEAGSPKAKDPAEMSLRERKALFERNKGGAIVPKAPFGQAPSAKALHGDNKADTKPVRPPTNINLKTTPTKPDSSKSNSKEDVQADNVSQTSVGGGIRSKLAALFSKEQTISETTIANKFKQERDREMEMLQTRFQHSKAKGDGGGGGNESDEDQDPSERAPLMGSSLSLSQPGRKPEVVAHTPKVTFEELKARPETTPAPRENCNKDLAVPNGKRRSSQDSPIVLSVVEEVKRIKVNSDKKKEPHTNGVVNQQPSSIYPHLSDIETDTSHLQDDSDCGSSSATEDKMNKSDNWAETSFGREVMNVVKKNNSSYNKAVGKKDQSDSSNVDSDLEDILDEALNEDDSEGPTPPKINKNSNSLSSKSFTYEDGSPSKKKQLFKSPLKNADTPLRGNDRGNELVHSVSFYRRMQNASSQPGTPMRVVRHTSPEREAPPTPAPAPSAVTVRERIHELHAEIAKQQTVISQASQALNLCASTIEFSGSTEQAEGERLLLLATHRRQACMHEAQRLQVEGAGAAARAGGASLVLRDLRLPLRRDYVRQLHADGAVGHHAVCLLKCRDRVVGTSMQLTRPAASVLHFPDEIRMDGLTTDFKVTVEVYLLQASKEFLPHDVKYHITNKKSSSKLLTPKSKGCKELKTPKIQSPAGPMSVRSPQFQPHGYCIFALPQADRKNFTLNKVPCGSPLEGSVSVEIVARVRVAEPPPHRAFLTAFHDVSGLGAWHRRWAVLRPPTLAFWRYPDDEHKKVALDEIDLRTVLSERAARAPRDLCARPHTLLLESTPPAGLQPAPGSLVHARGRDGSVVQRHLLAADTPSDRDAWLRALDDALHYVRCTPELHVDL